MEKTVEQIPDIPAGNICCLGGLDQFILKMQTLADSLEAFHIRKMKYTVLKRVRSSSHPSKEAYRTTNTHRRSSEAG